MPHFGLMDPKKLGPVEGALQRARLHIRGGKRRLRQGKVAAGIVTLYDALESAMDWYMAAPARRALVPSQDGEDLRNSKTLFGALRRSGILNGSFDFDAFDALLIKALNEDKDLVTYEWKGLMSNIERLMTELGVMPFDEGALPPESPSTF